MYQNVPTEDNNIIESESIKIGNEKVYETQTNNEFVTINSKHKLENNLKSLQNQHNIEINDKEINTRLNIKQQSLVNRLHNTFRTIPDNNNSNCIKSVQLNKKQYFKQVAIQIGSGSIAGLIEICILQPLDVIKVRFQTQTSDYRFKFEGLYDSIKKLYKYEGISVFYRGILPPVLIETPKRAIRFLCFEQYKTLFSRGSKPKEMTYLMAGAFTGFTDSIITNPFEVVKIALQTEKSKISTYTMTKRILNEGGWGLNGLQKGLPAIIWRNTIFSTSFFGIYNLVIKFSNPMDTRAKECFRKFIVGFSSSTVGALINSPFDVIKTKIQGRQPNFPEIKYKSLIQTFKTVYAEERLIGFYRGFSPRIMRQGIGGAILIFLYEEFKGIFINFT